MKLAVQSLKLHQHHTFASRHLNSYKTSTKKRLGKGIKVQSTAAERRRPGISRGMKKTQPGRPLKDFKRKIDEAEGSDSDDFDRFRFRVRKMSKVKKRKHDLSSNIAFKIRESGDTKITIVISACPNSL